MVGFHQDGLEIPARPISEALPAESWHQRLISSWETNHHHLSSANITITITITSHHHPSPSPIITKHQHPSSTIITSHQPMTPPSVSTQSQTELSTSKRRPTSSTKTNSVFFIGWSMVMSKAYHTTGNSIQILNAVIHQVQSHLSSKKNPLDLRMSAK